jgi:hypothetical protein
MQQILQMSFPNEDEEEKVAPLNQANNNELEL